MKVAVLGANGRLGRAIRKALEDGGAEAVAWPGHSTERAAGVAAVRHRIDATPSVLPIEGLQDCAAMVNAAPVADPRLHDAAFAQGCHVIDVTVDIRLLDQLLARDAAACEARRSVIAMAGLAPGLTGLMGLALLKACPDATEVHVCLWQNAVGSAGEQGTREMLDWLTDPFNRPGLCLRHEPGWALPAAARVFVLPTPETTRIEAVERLRFSTGHDRAWAGYFIRGLAFVRRTAPRAYTHLRDFIASRKAAAASPAIEPVVLSAVAVAGNEEPLAWRSLCFTSDYGATAAVAASTALLAGRRFTRPGAGHLSEFVKLDDLLAEPLVRSVLLHDSAA